MTSRATHGAVATLAMALLLGGCGSDSSGDDEAVDPGTSTSSEPTPSPTESETTEPSPSPTEDPGADAPACGDVWQDGNRLARAYKGCNEGEGASLTYVKRYVLGCSSGQRMVTYDDHYYAVLGGTIHRTESRLVKDAGYGDAIARCRG